MNLSVHAVLALFLLFFVACAQPSAKNGAATPASVSNDTLAVNPDSIEQYFYEGKYFFPTIIRLQEKEHAFVYLDSAYFGKNLLTPSDREPYYTAVRAQLPPEILKVHKIAWSLPEVRKQQAGDGGLYTVCTLITELGSPENGGFYTLEVRRNYVGRLGIVTTIPSMKINPETGVVLVADDEWNYLPLRQWRKLVKREQ